ncbi:MAG: urease accessory protein UreE [Alphaproteobacteria bacterium HGW-Alphaproteobacteria-6]|nr:MAG: urease accessory protein UreE [Alphaproteobacteria bacterium HGW-Alphaproteobacteria-6]
MTMLPTARDIRRRADLTAPPEATVTLDYEARMLRRRRLVTDQGQSILVDLAETVSLDDGDGLVLDDGSLVEVRAAPEAVLVVTGDLARLAWHVGNRHTPCQIEGARLVIREDHVLEAMLRRLGATVQHLMAPFCPEGGAYGHGRTLGHDHAHDHGHGHDHDHAHR